MAQHGKLDDEEFPARDLAAAREFFTRAFGWAVSDYGPYDMAFDRQGLEGGFYRAGWFGAARTVPAPIRRSCGSKQIPPQVRSERRASQRNASGWPRGCLFLCGPRRPTRLRGEVFGRTTAMLREPPCRPYAPDRTGT
jgi:catechol 2,3-dioxygenase-like lactoylglutathione lyase family enzyme